MYPVNQRAGHPIVAITSPNVDRYSTLIHPQTQQLMCNEIVTKDSTIPQTRRYTTM